METLNLLFQVKKLDKLQGLKFVFEIKILDLDGNIKFCFSKLKILTNFED